MCLMDERGDQDEALRIKSITDEFAGKNERVNLHRRTVFIVLFAPLNDPRLQRKFTRQKHEKPWIVVVGTLTTAIVRLGIKKTTYNRVINGKPLTAKHRLFNKYADLRGGRFGGVEEDNTNLTHPAPKITLLPPG